MLVLTEFEPTLVGGRSCVLANKSQTFDSQRLSKNNHLAGDMAQGCATDCGSNSHLNEIFCFLF